jgi:hypothetical protein
MANDTVQFLTPANPVGRLVGGSLTKSQTKDADGKPLVGKTGAGQGKPMFKFYIAVAVPKNGTSAWYQTEYGAKVLQVGQSAFGPLAQNPSFSWKIEDGDSVIPNLKGKTNASREGYPGNWILNMAVMTFEDQSPIQTCNIDGTLPVPAADINLGDYVQVVVNCKGNASSSKPGVYLNPVAVAKVANGERIVHGVDVKTVGFGKGVVLPPGASLTPIGAMGAPAPATGFQAPPPLAGAFVPPAVGAAPNAAILGLPAAPVPAAAPPPPAGPQLSAKGLATGVTLEAFLAGGWTLDTMKQNGYLA